MPNLKHKHTQQLDREQLLRLLAVLRKEKSADLKLTNLSVLDLINGDVTSGPIVINQATSSLLARKPTHCRQNVLSTATARLPHRVLSTATCMSKPRP